MEYLANSFKSDAKKYLACLQRCFGESHLDLIELLAIDLRSTWINQGQVFICGNGGSAANALHMANDFHYGIGACGVSPEVPGLRVEALSANSAVLTCLANDIGYSEIYSQQLGVKANSSDLLIVLSGSGNSQNVINAINASKQLGVKSYAIVAFDGGKCKEIADVAIHFEANDMQIAEDTQLIIGHMCMQWLAKNKP